MSENEKLAVWNTNELHERVCQDSKQARHILDADCIFDEGVFALFSLPCKLPRLFTVRFTAPFDYSYGDLVTLKGEEFKVVGPDMAPVPDNVFRDGAVVQCDIDMERNLCFVSPGSGGGGTDSLVGMIAYFLQRRDELPHGWWFPSGEYYALDSVVGRVLNRFSDNFRNDWGITLLGDRIRLFDPAKFFDGGAGRFFRGVDGEIRLPGSIEGDAIRNITARITGGFIRTAHPSTGLEGAFVQDADLRRNSSNNMTSISPGISGFDASRVVPVADENRPKNIGMTPAIFLGV